MKRETLNRNNIVCFLLFTLMSVQVYLVLPVEATAQVEILPSHTGFIFELPPYLSNYEVVGEVKNVGNVTVSFVNVTATFYDAGGNVIAEPTGSTLIRVLLPGRKAPFDVPLIDFPAEDVQDYSLSVEFSEHQGNVPPLGLDITSHSSYIDEDGTLYITGLISNNQTATATNVDVRAIFYDVNDNVVAVSPGWLPSDIDSGDSASFMVPLFPQRVPYVYSYFLTAESEEYAIVSEVGPIPVSEQPSDTSPPVASAGSNKTVKVNTIVNFDAGGSSDNVGIDSYEWDFGDGTQGTGVTTTHTYTESGTYIVKLIVRDAVGNSDTDSITVTVLSSEAFPEWIVGVAIVVLGITVVIALLWKKR